MELETELLPATLIIWLIAVVAPVWFLPRAFGATPYNFWTALIISVVTLPIAYLIVMKISNR